MQHDLEIIQQRRRDYNRPGFAVQLCVLRYLGWTLSDIKFNASACFALRDLADSKLYAIGKPSDFPKSEKLLRGQINTKIIQENYDDVLRLAHSIRERHRFSITHYGKNRFLCKTKQLGYRAARNGAYRENDLHLGLPFERGATVKNS